ncbi:uncharacterized protein L203_100996 [Cryptococcus depauperatus CBS 7841]|uniref:Uncharacterized protein n=1 Tax=Cryptococcus depauperatus CBS 7841 TaxID=1295531 RepID=A0AAJ8JP48_9TREE
MYGKGAILSTKYVVAWTNRYPTSAALVQSPLSVSPDVTQQHVHTVGVDIVALERSLDKQGWTGAVL